MRVLVGFLLMAVVAAAGCARDVDRSPSRSVNASEPSSSTTNGEPISAATATQSTEGSPLACQPGTLPTKAEMTDLLARISTYAPLSHLTGPALEIEKQWLRLQSTGWPSEPGAWASHAWFDLSITAGTDQSYIISLEHGLNERSVDKFSVECSDGRWKVSQHAIGEDGQWLEPAREVKGQRGTLTPELVVELVKVARRAAGPWLVQVTSGNALEWGRVGSIYRARGVKPLPDPWKGATERFQLTQIGDLQAEGQFIDSRLAVHLEKVDGLWKIREYTEGGQWVGPPKDVSLKESGRVFDSPFGILLGITDDKGVERLFGTPDSVQTGGTGKSYVYHARKIEIWFNSQGKVTSMSMKTGAPASGVKVGSPVALWELVYGPQENAVQGAKQRLIYDAKDGKVIEIKLVP